ncbi:ABC transporter transmembrane domain-containing protein [Kitasatospora sp. NPDC051853]|uniref:ABC transporter transmembrane domain-containing protein n=1 Tax=Kitasatospora sp. NPDC051853 TaxID=3364058 RepID=UPI0037BC1737
MATAGPSGGTVLRGALRGQRRLLTGAALLGMGHQACEALVPVVMGAVIDRAVATGSAPALLRWLALLAVLFLLLSTCYRTGARLAERAGEQAAHRLRLSLTTRVLDPYGGAEAGHLPGALAGIATGDAKRVGVVATVLPFGVAALAGLGVSAALLLRISVPLGLLVLLGTPPLLWLGHRISRPLERRSGVEQERAARAGGIAADLVTGLRVLKGIGAEAAAVARYRTVSQDSLAAALRAARSRAAHDGGLQALTGLFIVLIALVGTVLAMDGRISVGELVAAVGLAQFLLGPFQVLTWANGEFAQGRASAGRIAEVLAAPPAVPGRPGTPAATATARTATAGPAPAQATATGGLRLRGVGFGALRGLDLEVAPGELLGVVTDDPAAAADLLRCLGREADPATGAVELDGTGLTALDPAELRRSVLVAHHDAVLFAGTLRENVLASPDGELTEAVLAASAADEVAAALPSGLDTEVSEGGRSLSGGQRQRVALARALAASPAVLVLHDPTTAVDSVTESRIAERLRELRRGRTTVLVTTSPALLSRADRVVLLTDGTVTADSTHHALTADPAYRTLVLA